MDAGREFGFVPASGWVGGLGEGQKAEDRRQKREDGFPACRDSGQALLWVKQSSDFWGFGRFGVMIEASRFGIFTIYSAMGGYGVPLWFEPDESGFLMLLSSFH